MRVRGLGQEQEQEQVPERGQEPVQEQEPERGQEPVQEPEPASVRGREPGLGLGLGPERALEPGRVLERVRVPALVLRS